MIAGEVVSRRIEASRRQLIPMLECGVVCAVGIRTSIMRDKSEWSLRSRVRRRNGFRTIAAEEAVLFDLHRADTKRIQPCTQIFRSQAELTKSW